MKKVTKIEDAQKIKNAVLISMNSASDIDVYEPGDVIPPAKIPAPVDQNVIPIKSLFARFTNAERLLAITELSKTNAAASIKQFYADLLLDGTINTKSIEAGKLLDDLITANVILAARKAAILA